MDEELTSSLLDEVFDAVDSEIDNSNKINDNKVKTSHSFLAEEFNADLDALLGKKDIKKSSPECVKNVQPEKEISLIHEDDLSISDEENFYGNEKGNVHYIKSGTSLIQNSELSSNYFSDGTPKNSNKWLERKALQDKLKSAISKFDDVKSVGSNGKDLLVDPVLFMKIVNPKVSAAMLKERMIGRQSISSMKVKQFVESHNIKEMNWVTGGAIVGTFVTKSQKGNQYCIWTLSDLKGDIKLISVFLFGTAFKDHWKLPLGTVVGILNPGILTNKNNRVEATLRVDSADKIMIFGTSKDYGTCKSKKNNGENCNVVVNKSSCDYCIYHVKQVYDKASRRPELQSNFTGKGLTDLRNKVLGKNEVFYGGKSFTAVKGRPNSGKLEREQEKLRMRALEMSDTTKILKDKDLLMRLNGEKKTKEGRHVHKPVNGDNLKKAESEKPKMIDLDTPITNKQILQAKANAIKYIRKNGPLKKPNEGDRKVRTPEQIQSLKRKLEAGEEGSKKMKVEEDPKKNLLKQKMERSGITEKFLQLMNSESLNGDLLAEGEREEREKYFNRLEVKEKMEEKMANTFKVECKAVRCLKCNYKSFSASDLCKKEKHPLKLVNAVKRFWKCGDCNARTVCLELVPLHSCKVCGGSKWEKSSMLPEKKAKLLPSETLSIRGHEEKFVGSCVKNANINLLVPDEGS